MFFDSLFPVLIFGGVLVVILKVVKPGSVGSAATPALGDDPREVDRFAEATARLEHRVNTIERIIAADNPNWRA